MPDGHGQPIPPSTFPTERQTAIIRSFQEQRMSVAELRQLPITQVAWLAKHQPEIIQHAIAQEQQQRMMMEESRQFYERIGYPEFAGKYEPFEVPKGYKLKELTEEKEGLKAVLVKVEAPSLAEQMEEYKTTPILAEFGLPTPIRSPTDLLSQIMGKKPEVQPLKGVASGVVRSGESLVYSVGRLMGFETPRIPATASGGLVSSAIMSVQKGQLVASPELEEMIKNPEIALGTIFGDILIGYGIGKAAQAVAKPITGRVSEAASKWLTKSYEESARAGGTSVLVEGEELGVIWKPSLAERLVMRMTGARPAELPTALVGLPTLTERGTEEMAAQALVKGSLGMTREEIGQLPSLLAGEDILGFTMAPKTAGFGFTTAAIETAREATEHGIKQGIKEALPFTVYQAGRQVSLQAAVGELGFSKIRYTMGYSRKLGFEKPHLPSLSELLKDAKAETTLSKLLLEPTERILPVLTFIPEAAAKGLPRMAPYVFGATVVFGLHLIPRGVQKPSREERVKPIPVIGLQPLTRMESITAMQPLSKTILGAKQAEKQTTVQKQVQKQIQTPNLMFPERQISRTQFPSFLRDERRISVANAILGKRKGAWYYKRHPVATGKEVAAHIFSGLPKQQRRRRR